MRPSFFLHLRRVAQWMFLPALAVVVWGELKPSTPGPEVIWDKLLHFTAYFGLATLATVALGRLRTALWAGFALAVFGGLLEIVQAIVGRDAEWADEVANILGVCAGVAAGRLSLHSLGPMSSAARPPSKMVEGIMAVFDEFKKFAMRGNVLDLAVGVVIGAAFTGIVNSLVKDIIMPPIGLALGGIDFSNFFFTLKGPHVATLADAQKAAAVTLNYGMFINAIINFLVVAIALFLLIRSINRLTTPATPAEAAEAAPPPPPEEILLLREIRDSLRAPSR